MKIVDPNDELSNVVAFDPDEAEPQIPIQEVLDHAQKAGLKDIIIVGRKDTGDWNSYLAMSCENGIVTQTLLRQALFHVEHVLFGGGEG